MTASSGALILCVDDYEDILVGWKMLFENEGYRVLTTADPISALRLFASHPVDEVILDYQIPNMTGDVVARRMKALKPSVPILMLSSEALPVDKLKMVDGFLLKADSIVVLLTKVRRLLNKYRWAEQEPTASHRRRRRLQRPEAS